MSQHQQQPPEHQDSLSFLAMEMEPDDYEDDDDLSNGEDDDESHAFLARRIGNPNNSSLQQQGQEKQQRASLYRGRCYSSLVGAMVFLLFSWILWGRSSSSSSAAKEEVTKPTLKPDHDKSNDHQKKSDDKSNEKTKDVFKNNKDNNNPLIPVCQQRLLGQNTWDQFLKEQGALPAIQRCAVTQDNDAKASTGGQQKRCSCLDPTTPRPRSGGRVAASLQRNREMVQNFTQRLILQQTNGNQQQQQQQPLNMVLYGDSIIEFWATASYLTNPLGMLQGNDEHFQQVLGNAPPLQATGLGVSGDVSPELLHRLVAGGEFVGQQNIDIYWVLIGVNDYYRTNCKSSVIAAGVISVLRALQALVVQQQSNIHQTTTTKNRQSPTIVANAILPFGMAPDIQKDAPWREVSQASDYIACYVESQQQQQQQPKDLSAPRLRFVNDTDVFLTTAATSNNKPGAAATAATLPPHVNDAMFLDDHLHPSRAGYQAWGERIRAMALAIRNDED